MRIDLRNICEGLDELEDSAAIVERDLCAAEQELEIPSWYVRRSNLEADIDRQVRHLCGHLLVDVDSDVRKCIVEASRLWLARCAIQQSPWEWEMQLTNDGCTNLLDTVKELEEHQVRYPIKEKEDECYPAFDIQKARLEILKQGIDGDREYIEILRRKLLILDKMAEGILF